MSAMHRGMGRPSLKNQLERRMARSPVEWTSKNLIHKNASISSVDKV